MARLLDSSHQDPSATPYLPLIPCHSVADICLPSLTLSATHPPTYPSTHLLICSSTHLLKDVVRCLNMSGRYDNLPHDDITSPVFLEHAQGRRDRLYFLLSIVESLQSSAVDHPEVSTATTVPPVHGWRGPIDYESMAANVRVMAASC